jgi:hypothetical protein
MAQKMAHQRVLNRLTAIQSILLAGRAGGVGLSSSVAGGEREAFVNMVLANALGPPFRTGTGEITDAAGASAGQIDIIVEYAGSLSFPLMRGDGSRLYLAEGVCAAFEVKSNIASEWSDVAAKATRIKALTRKLGLVASVKPKPPERVPFFAFGYFGWTQKATVQQKLLESRDVDGILVLGPNGIYCGAFPDFSSHSAEGPMAIFGLLLSIEQLTSSMIGAKPAYGRYR